MSPTLPELFTRTRSGLIDAIKTALAGTRFERVPVYNARVTPFNANGEIEGMEIDVLPAINVLTPMGKRSYVSSDGINQPSQEMTIQVSIDIAQAGLMDDPTTLQEAEELMAAATRLWHYTLLGEETALEPQLLSLNLPRESDLADYEVVYLTYTWEATYRSDFFAYGDDADLPTLDRVRFGIDSADNPHDPERPDGAIEFTLDVVRPTP